MELAKAQDLLGDSGQIYFIAKLQGSGVTTSVGMAKGHPAEENNTALKVITASSSDGYPTGIDPGPEGHDLVKKDQSCGPGVTPHSSGKSQCPPPFVSVLLHSPLAQSTQKPALRAHFVGF